MNRATFRNARRRDGGLAFKDALPDLIIGLVGIPIAFSLQSVAEAVLVADEVLCTAQRIQRQREGLIYFVVIILFYGLHSVALYMLFEVGQRLTRHLLDPWREIVWQRYLVLRTLGAGPFTCFVVGTLLTIGISFKESISVQFFSWSLDPGMLMILTFIGVLCIYVMIFLVDHYSVLMREYPVILPYYTAALTITVTLTAALFLGA